MRKDALADLPRLAEARGLFMCEIARQDIACQREPIYKRVMATRSLTLSIFRAAEAATITGMSQDDQRNKRKRKQISAIEPGKHAALTIYDLGEIALVQQFAAHRIASEGTPEWQRRESARAIGYWALRTPAAIEGGELMSDADIASAGDALYPIVDLPPPTNPKDMPCFFVKWLGKSGVNLSSLDIVVREDRDPRRIPVTQRGPFVAIPLRQIGEALAAKAGRPLARLGDPE